MPILTNNVKSYRIGGRPENLGGRSSNVVGIMLPKVEIGLNLKEQFRK